MLAVGPNGAGKTNLLESLHVGTQGFSPRTRSDAQLIRFGCSAARVTLDGSRRDARLQATVTLSHGRCEARVAERGAAGDGGAASARGRDARLHARPARGRQGRTCRAARVLRPDAGPPAACACAAADRLRGGGRAAKRCVAPRSRRRHVAGRDRAVDCAGGDVRGRARRRADGDTRHPRPRVRGDRRTVRPGRRDARLRRASRLRVAELESRLERDIERGTTGAGPHLHDVRLLAGSRDLRGFGSQGEQRLDVAGAAARRGRSPLRAACSAAAPAAGRRPVRARPVAAGARSRTSSPGRARRVVTATQRSALPIEPAQLVEVELGSAG